MILAAAQVAQTEFGLQPFRSQSRQAAPNIEHPTPNIELRTNGRPSLFSVRCFCFVPNRQPQSAFRCNTAGRLAWPVRPIAVIATTSGGVAVTIADRFGDGRILVVHSEPVLI